MIRYVSLSELTPGQLDHVRGLYEEAFPAWQRESFEAFVAADTDPGRLQLAMVDDIDVLGFATLARFEAVPWWFLEYFAVTRSRRNEGLGGLLWDAVVERTGAAGQARIVMEVERPDEAPVGSDERIIRERRIRFYERRGARTVSVPEFRVPRLTGGGSEELMLLVVASPGSDEPSGEQLAALVRSIYVEGYGLPEDSALLRSALESIEGRAR